MTITLSTDLPVYPTFTEGIRRAPDRGYRLTPAHFSSLFHGGFRTIFNVVFVDNHDVTRVASILTNENHLPLIYALLFGMPGIPCVYYGSEWGAKAEQLMLRTGQEKKEKAGWQPARLDLHVREARV